MPPKRKPGAGDDGAESEADVETTRPSASITMSEEMLQTLVSNITRSQTEVNRALIESILSGSKTGETSPRVETPCHSQRPGNFAKCTARFDGKSKDADELEAFIDAVEVYRECTNVSEEHALRGLPMLLVGEAAVWWQGAKATVTSWPDALQRLRAMFGAPRPAYKIFRDVFSAEQNSERADVFICKIRALLSKLPYVLCEEIKIDMIYGLLDRRIRKRVPRDSVVELEQLIHKVRLVEEALAEVSLNTNSLNTNTVVNPFSATVCSSAGPSVNPLHTIDHFSSNRPHPTFSTSDNSEYQKRSRPKCAYCKLFGHSIENCRKRTVKTETNVSESDNNNNTQLRCYGGGQLGVVRSKCSKCKNESCPSKPEIFIAQFVDIINQPRPIVEINVANRTGVAILDTGATHSIAGPVLYELLLNSGVKFSKCMRTIVLADGSQKVYNTLECTVDIYVHGRTVPTSLIVLPGAKTRTLLGRDFITKAGILLDLPRSRWHFSDKPRHWYPFVTNLEKSATHTTDIVNIETVKPRHREDKGPKLTEDKSQPNQFSEKRADRFAKVGPREYITHRLKVDPHREKNCSARESAKFLGQVIVPGELQVDPDKVTAIVTTIPPRNLRQLKTFLKKSSWYRRFIPNYAEVARPLTNQLKKDSTWTWSKQQQVAFEQIKRLVVSAPILRQADESMPFTLWTNSSGYCLGAVLLQGEGPDERPVEYASRLLSNAERNYNTTEREALAVVWALTKFRRYIERSEVIIKSDHQPLRWLMTVKSPRGRLARWALTLQEYNLRIEYTPGKSNIVADTLSRPPGVDEAICDIGYAGFDFPSRSAKYTRGHQLKVGDSLRGRSWADGRYLMSEYHVTAHGQAPKFNPRRNGPYRNKDAASYLRFGEDQ